MLTMCGEHAAGREFGLTQLAMLVGRNLSVLKSALPELRPHQRERMQGFVNQVVMPVALIALAIIAYKFWA